MSCSSKGSAGSCWPDISTASGACTGPPVKCHLASLRESCFFEKPACVILKHVDVHVSDNFEKQVLLQNLLNTHTSKIPYPIPHHGVGAMGSGGRVCGLFLQKIHKQQVRIVFFNMIGNMHIHVFSKSHICRLFKDPGFPKGRKMAPVGKRPVRPAVRGFPPEVLNQAPLQALALMRCDSGDLPTGKLYLWWRLQGTPHLRNCF